MAMARHSQFRNRINKMKGLPISEKMMLLRMGELIDGSLNNKTPTNPNPKQGRRRDRVTVTSGNKVSVGTRGALLQWNKVDNPNLLGYRVNITSLDGNALELNAIAYSNQFLFKGEAGSYQYTSSVLMRNGTSGLRSGAVQFTVSDSPMILEGDKFDVEDLGSYISQTVLCPLNYTAFVFASVVLDSFSDANDNPSVTLRLSAGETLGSSIFIEEFTLYPETEDLCNFDTGMGITRPSTATSRTGTFQTTQSVMFTPFQILEDSGIEDTEVKFWVTVTGHADDVVGLSCAIWVASEGLSEEITGTIVFPADHFKSLQIPVGVAGGTCRAPAFMEGTTPHGISLVRDTEINNIWSYNIWLKPSSLANVFQIFSLSGFDVFNVPSLIQGIKIQYVLSGVDVAQPALQVKVYDNVGTNGGSGTSVFWDLDTQAACWPLGVNQWHMLTVTFNGTRSGSKVDVYQNAVHLTPTFDDSDLVSIAPYTLGNDSRVLGIGVTPSGTWGGLFGKANIALMSGRIHQAGMWSVVLSASAITSLYNSGNGARVDWRNSFGNYAQGLDLAHYWKFGSLLNDRNGSIGDISEWVRRGGGAPTQANVDFNVANDVCFDLGFMRAPILYNAWDPTNRITIDQSVIFGDTINRETLGGENYKTGGIGFFNSKLPDATDIVSDFPGV